MSVDILLSKELLNMKLQYLFLIMSTWLGHSVS